MNRYTKSFTLTLVLYVAIFLSFTYSVEDKTQMNSNQKKSEQIVKFTIIQEPIPIEKKKEIIIKKKEIEKVVKKVIEKKKITKKIKPNEIEKKKKTIVKKKKLNENKKIDKVSKPQQTIVKQQIKQNKSIQKDTINHEDKLRIRKVNQNKYYTKIKEPINKNKTYPRMAIKRGIEGIVKIKFTISKDGELLSFHIVEGKKVFKKSISEAIKNSFPLTPPKDALISNTSLSLKIDYRLY